MAVEDSVDEVLALWKKATTPAKTTRGHGHGIAAETARCRPNNWPDFQCRVATFSTLHWFAKPRELDLLVCAQHGWVNAGPDELSCECCGAHLNCRIDERLSAEGAQKVAEGLHERLTSYHLSTCPWQANPSPASFCHLHFWSTDDARDTVLKAIDRMCNELAATTYVFAIEVDPSFLRQLAETVQVPIADLQPLCNAVISKAIGAELERPLDATTLVALAATGWHASVADTGLVVRCEFCNRSVLPVTPATAESEPTTKRLKTASFHPLEAHRWFCPWQRQSEEPPGWKQCADALRDPSVPLTQTPSVPRTKPTDVLATVHAILDF
ncbi:hypothetical protein ACHHYP_10918 [Achlya hypogyna]|uniref:C3HC-type domain-containing protein n=1 Tax=Achlya hypogyna TaxID=1202772 RepID=A0A1V9YK44_ACHHY|nr:hypothetical protein ACHHYP_10918 [Achlya hypogyna]